MADLNAKAPKVRSGDEINPVLASIIKISALVVMAALIVVVTMIIVKVIQNKKKVVGVFEDKVHLTLTDFKTITNLDGLNDDITDAEVKKVMEEVTEDEEVYFYFYFGSTAKNIDKDIAKLVNNVRVDKDTNYRLFLVDLESDQSTDDSGKVSKPFFEYLNSIKDLNDDKNINDLDFVLRESTLKDNPAFIITYNKLDHTEFENPFKIIYKQNEIKDLLGLMPEFVLED